MADPSRGRPGGPPQALLVGKKERPKNTAGTLRRLWRYLGARRRGLVAVTALVAVSSAAAVAAPWLMGVAIDRYIVPGNFRGLAAVLVVLLGLHALNAAATWLQGWVMAAVAQDTVVEMRRDLFDRLMDLPVPFFDRHSRGELMSRLANDVENVNVVLNQGVALLASSVLTVVGTLAMMIALSPVLTLLALVTVPLVFFATRWISRASREAFREQQKSLGALNGTIEETISGLAVVQSFGREPQSLAAFDEHNTALREAGTRALIVSGNMGPLMNLIGNIGFAVIAAGGGYMVLEHLLSVGVIAAFISYARQFTRPLNEIANQYSQLQAAVAGAERVFETMDEPAEPADAPGAAALDGVQGHVRLDDVSFGYVKDAPVLREVSLDASAGSTVALVGPTGAGKTTIVNLLTRFYDIDAGVISIDGSDIRGVKRGSLRAALGIVLQDTHLFSESVRENIRYGRPSATDAEVEEAARVANAEHFIRQLPQGWDTLLSEDGGTLSQGQRQLLAIARAVLADPAILVLDEATSSVDTRTELHIQEAMLRLVRGRTSFVIAHRLSTIRNADLILVIRGGRIVERGTHRELLAARGFYAELYESQLRRPGSRPGG